jgi:hypothetical protein
VLHEPLVRAQDDVIGVVAGLLVAELRLDQQPVGVLEGGLLDVLVGPMGGVAGLEADDSLPVPVVEQDPGLLGQQVVVVVAMFLEELDRPADEELVAVVEVRDAGVVAVGRAKTLAAVSSSLYL